jgi:hypothetical protein
VAWQAQQQAMPLQKSSTQKAYAANNVSMFLVPRQILSVLKAASWHSFSFAVKHTMQQWVLMPIAGEISVDLRMCSSTFSFSFILNFYQQYKR